MYLMNNVIKPTQFTYFKVINYAYSSNIYHDVT